MKSRKEQHCALCGKHNVASYNRPKSLHKTKRVLKPNLLTFGDAKICTRCLKTLRTRVA